MTITIAELMTLMAYAFGAGALGGMALMGVAVFLAARP